MGLEIDRIEGWPCKGTDTVRGLPCSTSERATQHGIVKIGAEHRLRSGEKLLAHRRLPPAHHLGVEPGGLHRVRARRPVAAEFRRPRLKMLCFRY